MFGEVRLSRVALLALAAVALPLACGTNEHPPSLADLPDDSGTAGRGGSGLMLGDADTSPGGPCGSQEVPVVANPPNLSFIIDHSASMGEALPGSTLSKYENARVALAKVLKAIGHRVNYGAAVFPGLKSVTGCEAGTELLTVGAGDPPSYTREGKTGPRLRSLLDRLSAAGVDGGTPVAPTLDAMREVLTQLEGDTYVVLITDGAPNCNADIACAASGCIPNIEDLSVGGVRCRGDFNCCDPDNGIEQAQRSCVDGQASLDAVQALSDVGIHTFVVGMPGSEPYEQLLSSMAERGGTARDGATKYYPVTDTDALAEALTKIAASVAISCEIPLDYEPSDPDYVNVYFDDAIIEYDAEDGWEWTDDGQVALRGDACERLMSGDVLEVQIYAGCKTVVK
jgi:hypothetical protein